MKKHGQRNFGINNDIPSRLYQFTSWNTNYVKRSASYNESYDIISIWTKYSSSARFHVAGPF